ncbi:MAG: hypothetical protein HY393_01275 [Candidatus Diapherotrites archaeon]|nr:hypothetical protein [Candidatus Diapherotrites archaeon]
MPKQNMYSKTMVAMQNEARRLKGELETYLEDLELFSKPEFWKALQEPTRMHKNLKAYAKEMGV